MAARNDDADAAAPRPSEGVLNALRENLLTRLRNKTIAQPQREITEIGRSAQKQISEKRYPSDAVEKTVIHNSLDRLRENIKVLTRADLVGRIENVSQQLGMRFTDEKAVVFISTDMFFIEMIVGDDSNVSDLKVHHECNKVQSSCSELLDSLNNGDFVDFTAQLEGLSAIYQLNAEPKVKVKAFVALQAMETDLLELFQWKLDSKKDTWENLKESCVGIVSPRRGGHAMRLTYFAGLLHIINTQTDDIDDPGIEGAKNYGLSVTVNLEASSANILQTLPTVSFAKDPLTGVKNDAPTYADLSPANSTLLPATFVLRLSKPLAVCYKAVQKFLPPSTAPSTSQGAYADSPTPDNILNLILEPELNPVARGFVHKGLMVDLDDQVHLYHFTKNENLKGYMLDTVPYTEAKQVPEIIAFLRKQALFNELLRNCARPYFRPNCDWEASTTAEVVIYSMEKIVVAVEHPFEISLTNLEFDLSGSLIECTVYTLSGIDAGASSKTTFIANKTSSIPLTVRALIRYWEKERKTAEEMLEDNVPSTSGGGGGGSLAEAVQSLSLYSHLPMGGDLSTDPTASTSAGTRPSTSVGGGSASVADAMGDLAGYLRYKLESVAGLAQPPMIPEDFTDPGQISGLLGASNLPATSIAAMTAPSPSSIQSPPLTSLASGSQMMQSLTTSLSQLDKPSDMEIADKYKNIWKDKTPNLKSGQLSITAIGATDATNKSMSGTMPSPAASLDVKRTGGIEIIPLTSANQQMPMPSQTMPSLTTMATSAASAPHSTITITPINTAAHSGVTPTPAVATVAMAPSNPNVSPIGSTLPLGAKRPIASDGDAAPSASASSGASTPSSAVAPKEKKRKKKRDDSPMGPPEKVYSRQNSPSSSPIGAGGSSMPNPALSTRPSPKHSPVYSSPKHTNTASNSPKSPFGTHSPKHGSSGKPSMSTLKSASSAVGVGGAGTSASSMKSRDKEKPTSISTAATLGGNLPTTATGGIGTLMAPSAITSKSSHLGLGGITSAMGMTGAQSVGGLQQQLKSVASLNQYLSGYGAGGGSTPSSSLSSSSDMTSASIAAASAAALALRKSQGIPPPPPPPVSLAGAGPGGSSGIGASGAGAAVSSMMSPQTQHHQQFQLPPQLPQQMPSQPPLSHGSERDQLTPPYTRITRRTSSSSATLDVASDTAASSKGSITSSSHDKLSISSSSGTEYQVKASQEGLKLTINKTTTSTTSSGIASMATTQQPSTTLAATTSPSSQPASTSKSTSSTPTTTPTPPKRHTGLKPGVISGPLSRKLSPKKKKVRTSPHSSPSSSAGSSPQSTTVTPSTSTSLNLNPPTPEYDYSPLPTDLTYDMIRMMHLKQEAVSATTPSDPAPNMSAGLEAFLGVRTLSTNFQIPRLSQRTCDNILPPATTSSSSLTSTQAGSSSSTMEQRNIQVPSLPSTMTQELPGTSATSSSMRSAPPVCQSATTFTSQQQQQTSTTAISPATTTTTTSSSGGSVDKDGKKASSSKTSKSSK